MDKCSIFYLSIILLFIAGCSKQDNKYYKRTFRAGDQLVLADVSNSSDDLSAFILPSDSLSTEDLSKLFVDGSFAYYQGSAGHQLVLEEGLRIAPNSALIHRELGVAYLKRGIADQFPRYYGKAADLDPVKWLGWRGYLYLYFYRDYQRAIDDFNKLDPLTPGFVDHPQSTSIDYMRGLAHHQLGEYAIARSYIKKHMTMEEQAGDPQYIDKTSYLLTAMNLLALDKPEEALEILDRSISWGAKWAELHYYRAKILGDLGRTEEAKEALAKAVEGYASGWKMERAYVEEFFAVYPEDFEKLNF
ncbi:MAG: hypothetical protein AAF741_11550 [Bacteroidota bacterium]